MLEDVPEKLIENLAIVLPIDAEAELESLVLRLKEVLRSHRGKNGRGSCPVYVVFKRASGDRAILQVGKNHYVSPSVALLRQLGELCGEENVHVNRMGRRM